MGDFYKGTTLVFLFLAISQSLAQTQVLTPGDVVIVGYNFKDPDEFSLLTLVDLQAGTQLFITDAGWDAAISSFRKGEGLITYTVPSGGIKAGQQIVYPYALGFQTQGMNGFFGLAMAGDQLVVFQGNVTTPHFLFGINDFNGSWQNSSDIITNQTSNLPPDLIPGTTALALNSFLQARFDCSYFQIDKAAFLNKLSNPINWIKVSDRVELPLQGCDFTSLPLVILNWDYQFLNPRQLILTVNETTKKEQDIVWVSEYGGMEEQLNCEFSNGKYRCSLPEFLETFFWVKPCIVDENTVYCGPYQSLQRDRKSLLYYTYNEIAGEIVVMYEDENTASVLGNYFLFDLLGHPLVQGELSNRFIISNLKQGVYVLKVDTGKEWKELKVWVAN